jgi:hypothetical protein
MNKILLIILISITVLVFHWNDAAAYEFYDGKLVFLAEIEQELDIRTHQDSRSVRYQSNRTKFRPELTVKLIDKPDWNAFFYFNGNYYYDTAQNIDSDFKRSLEFYAGKHEARRQKRPQHADEVIKDLFVATSYKNFEIRLGKQLVSWGETATQRVSDLINPMDWTYFNNNPVWEEYKMGLWMARIFWTPEDMWQDLSFELVVIPFEFIPERGGFEGAHPFFFFENDHQQKINDKRWDDAPNNSFNNLEIGLRLKGFCNVGSGVDWTLSSFYTRADRPVIKGAEGYADLVDLFITGDSDGDDIYKYPHYVANGATFATTWDRFDLIIAGEAVLKAKYDFAYGRSINTPNPNKERQLLDTALKVSRNFYIPGLSNSILLGNSSEPLFVELTWYYSKVFNFEYDRRTNEQIWWTNQLNGHHSSQTSFTLVTSMAFLHGTIRPLFIATYDTQGYNSQMFILGWVPTYHWEFSTYYMQYNETDRMTKMLNQVGFIVKYSFF